MSALPNLDRLIEDLTATLPLLDDRAVRRRPIHPSAATLAILGASYISYDPLDARAARLRSHPWELQQIVEASRLPVLSGRVRLSYFLAAIAYARDDLREQFTDAGQWNWVAVLEWLVLHGIEQYRLWPFIPRQLINELHAKSVHAPGGIISPLQLCVVRALPDVRRNWPNAGAAGFDRIFRFWLRERGIDRFRLFWLCDRALLRDHFIARPPEGGSSNPPVSYDVRPAGEGATPHSGVNWPAPIVAPPEVPGRRRQRTAYLSFGDNFQCVSVGCLDPSLIEDGSWHGFVRVAQDRTCVEVLGAAVALQLPAVWLPPCVLLLHLDVPAELRSRMLIRVLLDGTVIDTRSANGYAQGVVKIMLADRPVEVAPVLQIQFAQVPGEASFEPVGIYARLRSIQFWRLNAP
jgi:hypothetical protein